MPTQKAKKPVKKTAAKATVVKQDKPLNTKNGAPPKAAPAPAPARSAPEPKPDSKLQYKAFERGIQLLQKRSYKDAKEAFEKATQGPVREIVANAQSHIRMCERRMAAPAPEPK